MQISNNTKGILLSMASALALSNVYIFSKAALQEIHLAQFGTYWFGLGIIWNLLFILIFRRNIDFRGISKKSWGALGLIAVLEMIGTTLFFLAINTVENPAVVSFLANINPLMVGLMGFLLLKERFNRIELFGMGITLLGAVLISFKSKGIIGNLWLPGTEYIVLAGVAYAFSNVVAKKQIKKINTSILALSRLILLFLLSFFSLLYLELPFKIPLSAFGNTAFGSVLGPFLTATLGYLALKHIEISKASMVSSIRSLFVLIGAYLYFGNLPTDIQIIGGLLTMGGVVLISLGKLKLNNR
ncbi:MAG: DMT family transporter [Bacteroidales bacterium]|nr:DMT family transporter [Bacteroidales bacterium]